MMTIDSRRPGFALPTSILLLLLMTAGVVAAFARVSAEVRVVDNTRAETAAFAVAQSGLERYLSKVGPLTTLDTTIAIWSVGNARVRATLLKPAVKGGPPALYVIRSEGAVQGPGGKMKGKRTVAQLAYHLRGSMPVEAIWTSPGGLRKNGSSGTISGFDGCTTDSIAGVATPDGMFTQAGGGKWPVVGKPPFQTMTTQQAMADRLKQTIDWAAITNPLGSSLTTDIIICYPGTFGYDAGRGPCGSWPSGSAWADPNYWPTIIINGSVVDVPNNGRGVLVVTGNLTLAGGDSWDGILLVGNRIDDNGGGRVSGAVFSGLNVLKGLEVDVSESRADGTKDYTFNSCTIASAANRQSRWNQINAWVDNMSTW